MSHYQLASRREKRRVIPKRPWGRQIIVDGAPFMWRVNPGGVVIRSSQGYHVVSGDDLNGRGPSHDYDYDDGSPSLQPGLVADWIRIHLLSVGKGPVSVVVQVNRRR